MAHLSPVSPTTRAALPPLPPGARALHAHPASLNACALSPDGSLAVLAGDWLPPPSPLAAGWREAVAPPHNALAAGTAGVLADICGGGGGGGGDEEAVVVCAGHRSDCWGASVSADGGTAATCDLGGVVNVWSTRTGEGRTRLSLSTRGADPVAVSLSGDAARVLATDGEALSVWDVERGVEAFLRRDPQVRQRRRFVACALRGSTAVGAGEDGRVCVWDVRIGERQRLTLEGHVGCANGVAVAARDTQCVVSAGADRAVRVWDLRAAGRPARELLGHGKAVSSCDVSADGVAVVSAACDKSVRVWRGEECVAVLAGHGRAVESCAVSEDGAVVLSCGKDGRALVHVVDEFSLAPPRGRGAKAEPEVQSVDRPPPGLAAAQPDPVAVVLAARVFHAAQASRGLARTDGLTHAAAVDAAVELFGDAGPAVERLGEYAVAERLLAVDESADFRIREGDFVRVVRSLREDLDAARRKAWEEAFCDRAGGEGGVITLPQARQIALAVLDGEAACDVGKVKSVISAAACPGRRLRLEQFVTVMGRLTGDAWRAGPPCKGRDI
jgi:hypothetical protein